MRQLPLSAAIVAVVLFAAAVAGFGAALDGSSQAIHPVGLLRARGMPHALAFNVLGFVLPRSEEHTSELQSLMRISYAVFCLKKTTLLTHPCLYPPQYIIFSS